MGLSRRDAFRPCSRDSSDDKGQFCFISQKKLIGIGSLTVSRLYVFQCNMARVAKSVERFQGRFQG